MLTPALVEQFELAYKIAFLLIPAVFCLGCSVALLAFFWRTVEVIFTVKPGKS